MLRKTVFVLTFCWSVRLITLAQTAGIPGVCASANQNKVACTVSYLYNTPGYPNPAALPIYQGGTQAQEFDFVPKQSALTGTLGTELTTLPLTAPGSGFVFQLDKASGLEVRYTQSLGPILAERGETIGRHKLFIAFAYQYFKFTSEDGIGTNSFNNVMQHEQDSTLEGADLIDTNDAIDLKIHQFTAFATFGLTDRIDVSAVIPILDVRLGAYSTATIANVFPPVVHSFSPTATVLTQSFSNFQKSTGIGDVVFRGKARVLSAEHTKLAVGADLRLPTGDELNFRGSGAYGIRPFAALSYNKSRFAPHANLGFEINGNSILAGDFPSNTKAHLPNQLTYSLGTDVGITSRFTLAADWLGGRIINGFNVQQSTCTETFTGATGATCNVAATPGVSATTSFGCTTSASGTTCVFPITVPHRSSYSTNDVSVGAKFSPVKNLLISLNGIFKLDDPGLRTRAVPLISVGYTF